MKPEAKLSKEVRDLIKMVGGEVWSTEQGYRRERGGTRTTPGIPDLFVVFPFERVWTWAELKVNTKLSPAQEGFRTACLEAEIPWQLWTDVRECWDWLVANGLVEEA